MCFSPKMKVPKPDNKVPAPEPIPLEEPKGVDFGAEDSEAEGTDGENTDSTKNVARIDRDKEITTETKSAMSTAKTKPNESSTKKTQAYLSARNVRKSVAKNRK